MVLKSPKGIYMQLETGKIIAIRTALKVGHNKDKAQQDTPFMAREMQKRSNALSATNKVTPIAPAAATTATAATTGAAAGGGAGATATVTGNTSNSGNTTGTFTATNTKTTVNATRRGANHVQFGRSNSMAGNKTVQMGTAKPYNMKSNARTSMSAASTPDNATSTMLQGQYPMSNSNSSFDADISDDSQFLEKLGENLANQQHTDDDNDDGTKQMNKIKETTIPMEHQQQQQQQQHHPHQQQQQTAMMKNQTQNHPIMQSHHMNKVNNGVVSGNVGGGDTSNMPHTQMPNKSDQMSRPYRNANSNGSIGNADNYNSHMNNGAGFGGSTAAQAPPQSQPPPSQPPAAAAPQSIQNYNYNYNATQNNTYSDVQSTPSATGQTSQEIMHQTNVMNQSRQPDTYSAAAQHVR